MGGSPSPVGGPPPPPNAGPQGAAGTPPPSASAAPAPSPDFMTGLEHGLSNPLLQGAIASYLGTIGSPRREGWSRALAHGGLAGLGTFNQAEQQKSQLPLQAAQLAAEQQKIPQLQAQTKLDNARTEKLAGDPAANAASADSLAVMAQSEPSPAKKAIYTTLAPAVRAGTIGMDKVMTLAMSEDLNGARVEAAKASAKKSEAETGLIPTKEKEINAHIGEMGTASGRNVAETGKIDKEAAEVGKPKPVAAKPATPPKAPAPPSPLAIEKQARAQAEKDWASESSLKTRAGMFGGETHDDFIKARVAKYKTELGDGALDTSANKFGSHAETGEGLPAGSTPNGDGTWTLPDGSKVAPR